MTLLDNWRDVIAKAWSVRLIILSAILSGFEVALPTLQAVLEPLGIVPPGLFAATAFVITAAAGVARIIAQPESLPKG